MFADDTNFYTEKKTEEKKNNNFASFVGKNECF